MLSVNLFEVFGSDRFSDKKSPLDFGGTAEHNTVECSKLAYKFNLSEKHLSVASRIFFRRPILGMPVIIYSSSTSKICVWLM